MKVYTYSQARQQLSELLDSADKEEVLIRRRDGSTYLIVPKPMPTSPFAVPGFNHYALKVHRMFWRLKVSVSAKAD